MSHVMRKNGFFAYAKANAQISFIVSAKHISAFVLVVANIRNNSERNQIRS